MQLVRISRIGKGEKMCKDSFRNYGKCCKDRLEYLRTVRKIPNITIFTCDVCNTTYTNKDVERLKQ